MFEVLKKKGQEFLDSLRSDDDHVRSLFQGGSFTLREVDFYDQRVAIEVSENRIADLRDKLGAEKRKVNLIGTKNFEYKPNERIQLEFDQDLERVEIESPAWEEGNLFVAVDEFCRLHDCEINDGDGVLQDKIESKEARLKKLKQLRLDIS